MLFLMCFIWVYLFQFFFQNVDLDATKGQLLQQPLSVCSYLVQINEMRVSPVLVKR